MPNANPSCFQRSTFYAGIKIFNSLPHVSQSSRMKRQNLKYPKENAQMHTTFILKMNFVMGKDYL
jgi:hypothetical protein